MKSYKGFTLIEVMIVVAIIAILSMVAVPSFTKFLAKAKRAEAYVNLSSLAMAQKSYFAENGKYTTNLSQLGWKPEGNYNYTYGFNSGTEGQNYFTGQLKTPSSNLKDSKITKDGFVVCAAGDINGDGRADIICIDQNNKIKILQDDLK